MLCTFVISMIVTKHTNITEKSVRVITNFIMWLENSFKIKERKKPNKTKLNKSIHAGPVNFSQNTLKKCHCQM